MRKVYSLITLCIVFLGLTITELSASVIKEDTRAVWVSTVYNLDYPKTKNNITKQKEEFIQILEDLKEVGINTVVVQVRPKADALYASKINPWSDVLTGIQGMNPGYDPMEFMIEETHKRGMAFHAWLNPYRVTTSGTDLSVLSKSHPARLHPEWVISYNNALYYNPEKEEVKQHIVESVVEIIENYKVDGIHFDDYFYPSGYPLPAGETKDGNTANGRRGHINDMIQRVSAAMKKVNSSVEFGISPIGIWKNSKTDPTGSLTNGSESYYSVYADTRTWIKNEWIDYVVPQIYWEIGHKLADYEKLVQWWTNEVKGTDVSLYIGHGIYKDAVAKEIDAQLIMNRLYPQIKGSFYFSLRDLTGNRMAAKDQLASFYGGEWNAPIVIVEEPILSQDQIISQDTVQGGNGMKGKLAIGAVGQVSATTLNIRSGARVDRELVAKANYQESVTILDYLDGWYKVKLSQGMVGWASAEYIQIKQPTTTSDSKESANQKQESTTKEEKNTAKSLNKGRITATTLNIRSGARLDRSVITKVEQGTQVIILDTMGDWYKVKLEKDQIVGWANKQFIQNVTL